MRKDDYKELIKKLKFLVENHPNKKGVDKLVGLWEKMKNPDVIFILDKDVKKEIERLYDEISETDVVILFDGELNQEMLDWVRENFDETAQLISDSLSIDIEKAKDILQKTIDGSKFDSDKNKESKIVKVPVTSGDNFLDNSLKSNVDDNHEKLDEKSLLSRVFSLIENYNRVLSQLSIYSGNQSEKDDKLLSVLQENKPETGEVILKIPFKNKGAGAHLSELLIETFGEENGFELCSGCDFLTVIIREDGAPTVSCSDDEGSPAIEKDIDKFISLLVSETKELFISDDHDSILLKNFSDLLVINKDDSNSTEFDKDFLKEIFKRYSKLMDSNNISLSVIIKFSDKNMFFVLSGDDLYFIGEEIK
jgi:hypothetical protein